MIDRIPREVIRWAMRMLGVEEWLVSAVMTMYTGAKTVVRTAYGSSNGFEVKISMHQEEKKRKQRGIPVQINVRHNIRLNVLKGQRGRND